MMSDEDFKYIAENCPDVICRCSLDMVLRYVSPSSTSVLGWAPEEMVGMRPEDTIFAEDLPLLYAGAERIKAADGEETPSPVRMRRSDGSMAWIEIYARIVRDAVTDAPLEAVLVMRDVTERKLMEEKLSAMAMTDGLTGLANRRAFDGALEREWQRTLREGTQMSLLLLDIDHFKKFNDLHGHQVGDDCLRAVAAAATGAVRQTDTVARYGGEEIAIILPHADAQGALETAQKVRLAIEELRVTHAGNLEGGGWVTASIGVATVLARHGGTMRMPESLLLLADNALYKAKHAGRNRVEVAMLIAPQEVGV